MPKIRTKRPTLHDVAKAAGVSYQTVSRVINNKADVSAVTRERILSLMRELDYRPNKAAQSLSNQRSDMIEVMMLDVYATAPLREIVRVAGQHDYQLSISVITEEELSAKLDSAAARMVDGLLLIAPQLCVNYEELRRRCHNIPFVQIGAEMGAKKPSIIYDQLHGSQLAVQHLIALGHNEIVMLDGPPRITDAMVRHEGWVKAMEAHGLTPRLSVNGNFDAENGYRAVKKLLESGEKFTALFAANDRMAIGALHALYDHGLRVPADVSIVGFDDISMSEHFFPPLTTVRQDFDIIGRMATEYLVSLIEKPATPVYQTVLIPELVVRKSTARKGQS